MSAAHIRKRVLRDGTARYDVRYRRGGRYFPIEHAGTFRNARDARARRDLVTGWLAAGVDPRTMLAAKPAVTFREAADAWIAARRSISDSTRRSYRRHLAVASEAFENRPVDTLTAADINSYLSGLELAPASVKLHLGTVRQMLDSLDLPANPARHRSIDTPRVEGRDIEPPDADELVAILAHLTPRFRPVLLLMEQCGLRVTETLMLRPDDIEERTVRLRRETTKTRRPRVVPAPVWLTSRVRPPFGGSRQQVYNALGRAAGDAGVPMYGPHQWRHRRGTLWHRQGVPAVEVARRLGHAKTSVTLDVYTHARPVREADGQLLASLLM